MRRLSFHQTVMSAFLSADEIIDRDSPAYEKETEVWSVQKHRKPTLVVRPKTHPALQKTVKYLSDSELDFAVHSGGAGSSSATDVVLSMREFDEFEFDPSTETVIIGAGQTWMEVDKKMEERTAGYATLSSRVPYVGVGGSILGGGMSWLSQEYGLASDPHNLLDVQLVLPDGHLKWASTDPELLWALRGGGGNFGVVTAFKLKAYRYPSNIFAGSITFPPSALDTVSKAVSEFATRVQDPKMGLQIYVMDLERRGLKEKMPEPDIAVFVYDAHGKEHGRSEEGFKWALDIEGATDMTVETSIREVNLLQAHTRPLMSKTHSYMAEALIPTIDSGLIIRCSDWFQDVVRINQSLGAASFVQVEVMQRAALRSSGAREDTAWPHDSHMHVLQIGVGFPPGSGCTDELALDTIAEAPSRIEPFHKAKNYMPSFIDGYHNLSKIYGENYIRLRRLKSKVDPRGRYNKGLFIPPL